MRNATDEPASRGSLRDPETALGGADAVEKTTYVSGQGPSPRRDRMARRRARGLGLRIRRDVGDHRVLAVTAVLVYLLGFGR